MRKFRYTNIETKETYLFEEDGDNIKTIEFLGYQCPNGRLIKR